MSKSVKNTQAHKIIEKAGAERVSFGAGLKLSEVLEDLGMEIARNAIEYANHAGRKTVKASDINLAVKHYKRS